MPPGKRVRTLRPLGRASRCIRPATEQFGADKSLPPATTELACWRQASCPIRQRFCGLLPAGRQKKRKTEKAGRNPAGNELWLAGRSLWSQNGQPAPDPATAPRPGGDARQRRRAAVLFRPVPRACKVDSWASNPRSSKQSRDGGGRWELAREEHSLLSAHGASYNTQHSTKTGAGALTLTVHWPAPALAPVCSLARASTSAHSRGRRRPPG